MTHTTTLADRADADRVIAKAALELIAEARAALRLPKGAALSSVVAAVAEFDRQWNALDSDVGGPFDDASYRAIGEALITRLAAIRGGGGSPPASAPAATPEPERWEAGQIPVLVWEPTGGVTKRGPEIAPDRTELEWAAWPSGDQSRAIFCKDEAEAHAIAASRSCARPTGEEAEDDGSESGEEFDAAYWPDEPAPEPDEALCECGFPQREHRIGYSRSRCTFRPAAPTGEEAETPERIIAAAREEIRALCNGDKRWRMCVPVESTDSDEIFGRLANLAEAQATALAALRDLLNDALRFADNVAHRAAYHGEEDSDAIILADRIRAALDTRTEDSRSNGTTAGHNPDVLPQGMTFHAGELGDAYVAGAKSGRAHQPTDEQIARACDAYVKHAHLVRLTSTPTTT